MLTLNANDARQADNRSTVINESGAYIGTITRAEKLTSKNGASGLGLSFKDDSGATANYLDLYTANSKGEKLPSNSIVHAILVCLKQKNVPEGEITVERWDKAAKTTFKQTVAGYPSLIGKKIGLLLQKELSTNDNTGEDNERMVIYGVFEADTGFTTSEILDKALKAEKMEKMKLYLESHPVNDRRKTKTNAPKADSVQSGGGFDDFPDDSVPF